LEIDVNEQRKDILDMLAEGKISAEEAEQLIAALERDQSLVATNSGIRPKGKAKYLRLEIDTIDNGEPGRVNARVPLQLLRAGVRLTALIPPQALAKANAELTRSGVPFDLTQLKPGQLEDLVDQLDEVTFEIDQPDAKVRIFCE
jgi:SHOCT-like domain